MGFMATVAELYGLRMSYLLYISVINVITYYILQLEGHTHVLEGESRRYSQWSILTHCISSFWLYLCATGA